MPANEPLNAEQGLTCQDAHTSQTLQGCKLYQLSWTAVRADRPQVGERVWGVLWPLPQVALSSEELVRVLGPGSAMVIDAVWILHSATAMTYW
mmetsp:Transcript_141446/g.368454  ORF Transcript_141446/g.368454 Transcript_141446/m.368454 type:complete len:93 (-) Transcript_141446:799-1077(-)